MAVTGIRKISRWTLYAVAFISIAVLALFAFGGVGEPYGPNAATNPIYTGELLIWCYVLLAVCAIGMLLFGITQFATKFISNPKGSIVTLLVLVAFAILFIITYALGDTTPFPGINEESQQFNTDFWLKVTDMWLYTMYIMAILAIAAIIWGSAKKIFGK